MITFERFNLHFEIFTTHSLIKLLDYKIKVNLKIYDVAPWLKTIKIHILTIFQSKDNEAIKLCQLIKENKRSIFIQKIMQKKNEAGALFLGPFLFILKFYMRLK